MKTFEERYTAWIDGQLTGSTLTAFEQELARRAEAGDAEADKADALQLRALLKEHLQAPALDNAEFFTHQMRQRIDADCAQAARRRESATGAGRFRFPAFAWPFARLAGAGAAFLFVAAALYYGLVPPHNGADKSGKVAQNAPAAPTFPAGTQVASNDNPTLQPQASARPDDNQYVKLSPTPTPAVNIEDDVQARVLDPGVGNSTTVTPLHINNANVLWVNNLPYLPSVPGAESSASPAATPSAAASVTP